MNGQAPGEVALVLHTHLPWLKNHGVWPVGEEWLFQAWGESWLPVTDVLLRLADEGRTNLLTLGVTPMVAAQVTDSRLADDMGRWLGIQLWRAEEQRTGRQDRTPEVMALGPWHWQRYQRLLAIHERIEAAGGLLHVWSDLASRGVIELLGGPLSHPYLPLQTDEGLIDAQLEAGLAHHRTWSSAPTGLWAPEMAYRPRGPVADATAAPEAVDEHGTPRLPTMGGELPGLEEQYAKHGITHFLVDAATLVRAAGGVDRDWTTRPAVPDPAANDPYEVVHDGVLVGDSDVVAFARDLSVAYHVWSPDRGYPGDPWYRDFFSRGSFAIHPSWRVTDKQLAADQKAIYEPDRAAERVTEHAGHLHGVLHEVLDPRPGDLVVAAYDTELFGHWWFEGVDWLETLLRRLDDDATLVTTTLADRLERRPPQRRLDLPESSWGYAKGHASWVTDETRPMWTGIREAEARARSAVRSAGDDVAREIARQLALLSSSDWPFLVTRGNSPGYGFDRFNEHAQRLHDLCDAVESDADTADLVAGSRTLDGSSHDLAPLVTSLRGDA
ncbi:MAG: 1,4-alpha-glucan branching protein domain-containing protein [Nitriliruptorales bacterium]|nr:1,4-alpha-glucan branching protein domain-containing protein [Nitriliruptorales bacterium]